MKKQILDIISKKSFYPCRLAKNEGETLKKFFTLDREFIDSRGEQEHLNSLEFKYTYSDMGEKFILLEEFLFKENAPVLDIHSAIDVNYYLNKR